MKAQPFFTGYLNSMKTASWGILVAPFSLFCGVDWRDVMEFFMALFLCLISIALYPVAVFVWPLVGCYENRRRDLRSKRIIRL